MLAACESEDKPRDPSAALLISLGNVAAAHSRYGDALWFWNNAGIEPAGLIPAVMEMLEHMKVSLPIGKVTAIPEYPVQRSVKSGSILFDSRLLRNPFAVNYVVAHGDRRLLFLDTQQADIWRLSSREVAVVPRRKDSVESLMRTFSDPALARYLAMFTPQAKEPAVQWGPLTSTMRDGDTFIALEARNPLGLSQSYIIAIETSGGAGRVAKRIESPFFGLLGRVIAQVDLREGPISEPYTYEEFERDLKEEEKRAKSPRKEKKRK